jgi:hypothetical protein
MMGVNKPMYNISLFGAVTMNLPSPYNKYIPRKKRNIKIIPTFRVPYSISTHVFIL